VLVKSRKIEETVFQEIAPFGGVFRMSAHLESSVHYRSKCGIVKAF
jgi:hypothetical protein